MSERDTDRRAPLRVLHVGVGDGIDTGRSTSPKPLLLAGAVLLASVILACGGGAGTPGSTFPATPNLGGPPQVIETPPLREGELPSDIVGAVIFYVATTGLNGDMFTLTSAIYCEAIHVRARFWGTGAYVQAAATAHGEFCIHGTRSSIDGDDARVTVEPIGFEMTYELVLERNDEQRWEVKGVA